MSGVEVPEIFPVFASRAIRMPPSSPLNTRPPAVATVPAHIVAGPGMAAARRSPRFAAPAREEKMAWLIGDLLSARAMKSA